MHFQIDYEIPDNILRRFAALPVLGQPFDSMDRKSEIEECTKSVYSINEFRRVADSLKMTIDELSYYPVIFPIKKPQRISSNFGWRIHPIYSIRKIHTGIEYSKNERYSRVCHRKRNSYPQRLFFRVRKLYRNQARWRFPVILCTFKQNDGDRKCS